MYSIGSMKPTDGIFDGIRPYSDAGIPDAMHRIAADPMFPSLAGFVFPERDADDVRRQLLSITTIGEFQRKMMYNANRQIIRRSITALSYGGISNVTSGRSCLFVSNHRDIMLDASLLQNILLDNGLDTSEITFGANLMQGQLIIDIGKSNKMFRVERPNGSARDLYKSSQLLSDYIRDAIVSRGQSVWIAQRNGRTKDGRDRTDQGLVKMLCMSGRDGNSSALADLNIVPVSVSYEWESCDFLKVHELHACSAGPYVKRPGEDLNSILTGILQPKGRVHIEICSPVTADDLVPFAELPPNAFHHEVADIIDRRICSSYRLYPNNYIAHDMLHGADTYSDYYSSEEKELFIRHLDEFGSHDSLLLGIYANPVDSRAEYSSLK